MEETLIFVTALRLVLPLLIFRWALFGTLASLILDVYDFNILRAANVDFFDIYQPWDKILDTYYLSIAFYVSLSWENRLARGTSITLFLHRLAGIVIFLITELQPILFFFPNLFENFFILYLGYIKIFKKDPIKSKKILIFFLIILLIPKMIQEYIVHMGQVPYWTWF
jgi:hypothetical protein